MALRVCPAVARMVQIARITHCSRLVWNISTIRPVRPKRSLVVRYSRCKWALNARAHHSAKLLAIHLIRQLRLLQRWNLIKHGVDLRRVLACSPGPRLKVETWAPVYRPLLLVMSIGAIKTGGAQGKVLLQSVRHARLGSDRQQYVFRCMWRPVVLHRCSIVGGCKDSIRRLTAEHVLGRFRSVARLGRLRGI